MPMLENYGDTEISSDRAQVQRSREIVSLWEKFRDLGKFADGEQFRKRRRFRKVSLTLPVCGENFDKFADFRILGSLGIRGDSQCWRGSALL